MTKKNLPVANISNQLAFNLSWNLTFREWNVVLYLISKLDSKNQKSFDEQVIPVKELESALKSDGKKWGGMYKELEKLRKSLLGKPIDFYTDVIIDDKPLMGGVNFFEMIVPQKSEDGTISLKFKFTGSVKPLLLELNKHFVSIPQHKTKLIKNGHAIRFLIAAKAKRDMMRNHETISSLKYGIEDFKVLLGIPGKYKEYREFKRSVIGKIEKEINERCDFLEIVEIITHPIKSKPITEIEFKIADRNSGNAQQLSFLTNEDWQPSQNDIELLSRSKLRAYQRLVSFGLSPGIAFRQFLGKIKGSEFLGFEDWYIDAFIKKFETKTRIPKSNQKGRAGAFVNWFLNTTVKDDQFATIMESIQLKKKQMQSKNPPAWENRQLAKDITAKEFDDFISKKVKPVSFQKPITARKGIESIADILIRQ